MAERTEGWQARALELADDLVQTEGMPFVGGAEDETLLAHALLVLADALRGTKERTFIDDQPCWCPGTVYEDHRLFADSSEFVHSEWCEAARTALGITATARSESRP